MKIVCDACGAKYSIADDKVRGKVFKIRCKRCSNIIVVRGESGAAEAAATEASAAAGPADEQNQLEQKETRVFDYSGYDNPAEAAAATVASEAIWHVVIDQEQIGPMTAADVGARFHSGQIDADTYIWHEGFTDWQRLADVDEFRELASGDGGGDAALFGGPDVDTSSTAQNDPADVFAAATSAAPEAEPGADLFGAAPASAPAGGDAALFGGQAAADDAGPKLKGERNENSVLFSLSNLASLAGGEGGGGGGAASAPTADSGGAAAPAPSKTTATQEGSGLIDIRSMAQVYLGEGGSEQAPAASTGTADDIPTFGAASFGAAASPMLLPMAPAESGNKKLLLALFGVIGLLAVVAVVLVVLVVKGGDEETVASTEGDTEQPAALAKDTEDVKKGDLAEVPGDEKKDGEDSAKTPPTPTPAGDDSDATKTKEPEEPKPTTEKKETGSSRPAPKPRDRPKKTERRSTPTPKPPPKSGGAGCDEVTCLVEPNKACCKKYRSSGGRRSGGSSSSLPERPSKSDVKGGISKVMGRVRSCGGRHGGSGVVKVRVKVASSGRVSSASPSPANALGNCVAGAVRKAKFPKTQRGVTFTYPFRF